MEVVGREGGDERGSGAGAARTVGGGGEALVDEVRWVFLGRSGRFQYVKAWWGDVSVCVYLREKKLRGVEGSGRPVLWAGCSGLAYFS